MQLLIPAEAAHQTITALGEIGLLQFKVRGAGRCSGGACPLAGRLYRQARPGLPPRRAALQRQRRPLLSARHMPRPKSS